MAETSVRSSQLHLKELKALGKVPTLREPQIFSSSRSHSYFKSSPVASLPRTNGAKGKEEQGMYSSIGSRRPTENRVKRSHLYNWVTHSSKSGNSETREDQDGQRLQSAAESSAYNSQNYTTSSRNERTIHIVRYRNQESSERRKLRKMSRSSILKTRSLDGFDPLEHLEAKRRLKPSHLCTPSNSCCSFRGRYHDTCSFLGETSASFGKDGRVEMHQLLQRNRGLKSLQMPGTPRVGGRTMKCQRRPRKRKNNNHSSISYRQKPLSEDYQSVPLLEDSSDLGDEISNSIQELDLESLNRMDRRRKLSDLSNHLRPIVNPQLGQQHPGEVEYLEMREQKRSICDMYRPRCFYEIVGQKFVVRSLKTAIAKGRIAHAYVFEGPSGTGKTSAARVFAAALNCQSARGDRPCGFCDSCTHTFSKGKRSSIRELRSTSLISLFKHISMGSTLIGQYTVFIVDWCYSLPSEMRLELCRIIEDPPPRAIFIFTVTEPAALPHSIMSRCKKYQFSKIVEADIVCRLRTLCAMEDINVEDDALNLIACHADGSLREAEMMLDQLTLIGKRITTTVVKDLIGLNSDEKLLSLLKVAMSSDGAETVRRSRELMASGVDPVALMSHLAGLLVDIIAGTHKFSRQQCSGTPSCVTELGSKRLQQALRVLSDAERRLCLSCDRSTWFTAALLRLGSTHNRQPSTPSNNNKIKSNEEESNTDASSKRKQASLGRNSSGHSLPMLSTLPRATTGFCSAQDSSCSSSKGKRPITDALLWCSVDSDKRSEDAQWSVHTSRKGVPGCASPGKLELIWRSCITSCHFQLLRKLLSEHLKLISVKKSEGGLVAYLAAEDDKAKYLAEGFLSSITDLVEKVLKHNVQVVVGVAPDVNQYQAKKSTSNATSSHQHNDANYYKQDMAHLPSSPVVPHEQRLDNAWQEAEQGETVSSIDQCVPDEQRLENYGLHSTRISAIDDQNEISELKNMKSKNQKDGITLGWHHHEQALSPSLLHISNFNLKEEYLDVDSSSSHKSVVQSSRYCCWSSSKTGDRKAQMRRERNVKSNKGARSFRCFNQCWN